MTSVSIRPAPSPLDPWGPRLVDRDDRLVFETMGTVASLAVPAGIDPGLRDRVQGCLADWDARFSLFRPASEGARVDRGELTVAQASGRFRRAFRTAETWRERTDGAFSPYPPSGGLDLAGVVKALAIREAGDLLIEAGATDWCLDVGGDVLVAGSPAPDRGWKAGVCDPSDRQTLVTAHEFGPGSGVDTPVLRALATSGTSERGEHIWRSDHELAQVSVLAADIVTADVLATAILARGEELIVPAIERWDADVLAIGVDGRLLASPAFAAPRG